MLQNLIEQLITGMTAGVIEGTGIPWPGSVMVAAASVSNEHTWLSLVTLMVTFSLAYCMGSLAQYVVGRMLGSVALSWLPEAQRTKVESLMTRYGQSAVLWSRPLAIGNYVSLPAGMMGMPLPKFLVYTFLGALPWSAGLVLLGRLLGTRLGAFTDLVSRWTLPAVAAFGAVAILMAVWKVARRRSVRVAA